MFLHFDCIRDCCPLLKSVNPTMGMTLFLGFSMKVHRNYLIRRCRCRFPARPDKIRSRRVMYFDEICFGIASLPCNLMRSFWFCHPGSLLNHWEPHFRFNILVRAPSSNLSWYYFANHHAPPPPNGGCSVLLLFSSIHLVSSFSLVSISKF
jgi:hypothetical protein